MSWQTEAIKAAGMTVGETADRKSSGRACESAHYIQGCGERDMTETREYTTREIPYWLYKAGYEEFQAAEYNPKTKTIKVTLPKTKPVRWPKEWKRAGNSYRTPKGTAIYYWNTGLARNYEVRRVIGPYYSVSRTIGPGINSFSRVLNTVEEFEAI